MKPKNSVIYKYDTFYPRVIHLVVQFHFPAFMPYPPRLSSLHRHSANLFLHVLLLIRRLFPTQSRVLWQTPPILDKFLLSGCHFSLLFSGLLSLQPPREPLLSREIIFFLRSVFRHAAVHGSVLRSAGEGYGKRSTEGALGKGFDFGGTVRAHFCVVYVAYLGFLRCR
mgnify:CR=1 FL=1